MTPLEGTAFETAYRDLCAMLSELRAEVGARAALLADAGGRLVLQAGETPGADPGRMTLDCAEAFPHPGAPGAATAVIGGPGGDVYIRRLESGMMLVLPLGSGTAPGFVHRRCRSRSGPLDVLLAGIRAAAADASDPRERFTEELTARIDALLAGEGPRPADACRPRPERPRPSRLISKVVFWGPGLGGKTANLRALRDRIDPRRRGPLTVLDPGGDPGARCEFLPVDLGDILGLGVRFHLWTTPGRLTAAAVRRRMLAGADGVIFVADSAPDRVEATVVSWHELLDGLREAGRDPESLPMILQYNKRDFPGALPLERLEEDLNAAARLSHPATALVGDGVVETFRFLARRIARDLGADAHP